MPTIDEDTAPTPHDPQVPVTEPVISPLPAPEPDQGTPDEDDDGEQEVPDDDT